MNILNLIKLLTCINCLASKRLVKKKTKKTKVMLKNFRLLVVAVAKKNKNTCVPLFAVPPDVLKKITFKPNA